MALDKVVRDVTFDTASLNSGASRWTDVGGRDNHLSFTAGTPTISTVGSHDAWQPPVDSSVYTEFKPCQPWFTVILAIYHDSTYNKVHYYWLSGADSGTPYATDDHSALTEPATWTDQDCFDLRTNNTALQAAVVSGETAADTITKAQWNIVTAAINPDTYKVKIQLNDDAVVVAGVDWVDARQVVAHRARLGFMEEGGSISGTAAYGAFVEIEGDAFTEQNTELQAKITALMTEFGVP